MASTAVSRITASDRLRRLLALLPWVAAHEGPTVDEVCARFALDAEDLLSDVALVSMVGIPPYSPGDLFDIVIEGGRVWVHLSPSFDRALRLTPEEGLGLVAAAASLLAVPGADPDGPLARAIAKVAATLGVDSDDTIDVDLGYASVEVLGALQEASAARRRVRIDYYVHGRDERTTREVDPYRVSADHGQWYLVGFDHLRDDERLFRVDRVVAVEVLHATFDPPEEQPTLGLFEARPDDPRVVLELEPEAAWVVEVYPVEAVEHGDAGRLRATMAISARPWLERLLLRLGPRARIVHVSGDTDLAGCASEAARRVLARYQ
ncbi:MAG: proteasome accessory factor [Acidimicrobiaceae bacterium]|jgi:proteasome accessory factor C